MTIFMAKYNSAFFSVYENLYMVLKENLGEDKALELFRQIMDRGLKKAYDAAGFVKGEPQEFVRVVSARDQSVGLCVEFPEVRKDKIVYQFHIDPFPGLKGNVDPHKLDDTYMAFKIKYLLGDNWTYKTTKHIWKGELYTEHVISKKA